MANGITSLNLNILEVICENRLSLVGMVPVLAKAIQDQQKEINDLKLVLGPEGTFGDASSTAPVGSSSGLFGWLVNGPNSIGLALKDGVASLREIIVQKITGEEGDIKNIHTEQICVKDSGGNEICLTGDQLKELIERSGSSMTVTKTFVPDGNGQTVPVSNNEIEENAAVGNTASTTSDIISPAESADQGQVTTILEQIASETITATTTEE